MRTSWFYCSHTRLLCPINHCDSLQQFLILHFFPIQIVAIRDIIPPPLRDSLNDVYIAYELMDTDLHQIIRSNQALSDEHCQVVIFPQTVNGACAIMLDFYQNLL